MSNQQILPLVALGDNYIWIIPTGPHSVAVVDPGSAAEVDDFLQKSAKKLSHILITHHHYDHIDGISTLAKKYQAKTIGSANDQNRLPKLDQPVKDGDTFVMGTTQVTVFETPGHTSGHVAYLVDDALFPGDTIFSIGVGRLSEGTAEQMWNSIKKLRALPGSTAIYPAHEYTFANFSFARHLEPNSRALAQGEDAARALIDADRPTLPTTLDYEKKLNPFLRADQTQMAKLLNMEGSSPTAIFAEIRTRRDNF